MIEVSLDHPNVRWCGECKKALGTHWCFAIQCAPREMFCSDCYAAHRIEHALNDDISISFFIRAEVPKSMRPKEDR